MKTFIDIFKTVMAGAVFLVSAVGCSDEIDYPKGSGPEGEDTKLTLKINVAEATKLSRATSDSYVKSLWIGIYNVNSGERTNTQWFFTQEKDVPGHNFESLGNIDCKSGNSYIVAVANYEGQTATDMRDKTTGTLAEKLEAAVTWEDYCAIAIEQNLAAGGIDISIAEPSGELVMSGAYYESNHGAGIAPGEIKPVNIPARTANLAGAIHLCRLWAKNTLNISAAGDIVSMELLDVEIMNVPKYSWVQDRATATGLDGELATVNAGDIMDSEPLDNSSYLTSMRFTPPSEITVKDNVYSFTFWQFENKRTGTATTYEEREKEFKDAAGKNSGIYTSLCSAAAGDVNNNATYVKIHANITYKNPGSLTNPDGIVSGDGDNQLPTSAASRSAEVTYVVHLGYINKIAGDFNCIRNANYTYNITAESVGKILLEAFIEGNELQPGAEGTVTDVTDKIENMDSHSGQFNIFLTADQVKGFTFSMRTYVSGEAKNFYYNSATDNNIPLSTDNDFKYYNWIEFVPTGLDKGVVDEAKNHNNERIFAEYPNIVGGRTGKKIYYPHELPTSGEDGQWFTVFVYEYAYERPFGYEGTIYGNKAYGDETGSNWKTYVNQPNRQAWFNVAQETSKDGESVYYKSKYALTQRSLQTYYNVDEATCTTALALEHINESFGQNIRWLIPGSKLDTDVTSDNGRFNVWNGLTSKKWSDYISETNQQYVKEITNTGQVSEISTEEAFYPVVQQVLIARDRLSNTSNAYSGYNTIEATRDPQITSDAQFIEALFACMNRNRDENGDGVIDASEVKWYLPASGKYLRVILGRNSLSAPLIDYKQKKLPYQSSEGQNTLYHYISSDAKIIWLEEGASSSFFTNESQGAQYRSAPWQLRCIRNLGTDLTKEPTKAEKEQLDPAYDASDYDKTTGGGLVTVKHYYGTALREPTTLSLPMHKTGDPENKLARYGFEIAPRGNTFNGNHTNEAAAQHINTTSHTVSVIGDVNYDIYTDSVSSYCNALNERSGRTGWRVPNQKELVIMLRMEGLLSASRINYYYTTSGGWWDVTYTLNIGTSNDTKCFVGCTQEHWANDGTIGSSEIPLSKNYRITTINPYGDGLAIATANWSKINAVRCVRDLTASEANRKYSEFEKKW